MHQLNNVVTLACNNFLVEGITNEMFSEAKVIRLRKITEDLCENFVELEAQVTPNTPLEVLEERRKTTIETAKKIEEVEELCAKIVK